MRQRYLPMFFPAVRGTGCFWLQVFAPFLFPGFQLGEASGHQNTDEGREAFVPTVPQTKIHV